ncbi:MAG TPA: hypothetical protein VN176_11860 [Verrucomicrobiae bacterium]|jgi:hypothetical protein|nr:hypothetical protein [Verrucomicrobiae bacterium]
MNSDKTKPAGGPSPSAAQRVAEARDLLRSVSEKHGLLEKHPQLAEALTKLELALNELTIETGGLL